MTASAKGKGGGAKGAAAGVAEPGKGKAKRNGKASKAKGAEAAAAIAETNGSTAGRTVTVRGLELALPDQLPATLMFDIAEMQSNADALTFIRTLTSFIGREQMAVVRGKVAAGEVADDELGDYLSEILFACMEPFGMTLGEAEASPTG